MAFVVRPHSEELAPEVSAFNSRLRNAGLLNRVPESPVATWLPKIDERSIFQEYFLGLAGETVRGAYILKHQAFLIGNETISIGHYTPISEGLIDRAFA